MHVQCVGGCSPRLGRDHVYAWRADLLPRYANGESIRLGDKLSLDDLLIVSAIYPCIAKKSAYPCPASISKQYIGFMKYVKRV